MKLIRRVAGLCLLLSTAATSSLSSAADNGWTTLIEGAEGMDNFNIVGDANWSAGRNAIEASSGSAASFLVSKQSYGDFSLRVEFWASEEANSGIFMRCQEPDNINDRNCYEANIYDQRADPSFGTGGIVHIAAVTEPFPKVGGQWNVYLLTLQGDHLLVELNGKITVDTRDSLFSRGPIALQWGRGSLRFRKVEIMPL